MIFGRRDLLKSLVPVALVPTLTVEGKAASEATLMHPGTYLMFIDEMVVNLDDLAGSVLPVGITVHIFGLKLRPGQNIDDAVRLYELGDTRP